MKYNILVGGTAGQGMDTVSLFLEKIFKKAGLYVFSNKDYMSRVRGGNNFTQIRVGDEPITAHTSTIDIMIALDLNTVELHGNRVKEKGVILVDTSIEAQDNRVVKIPMVQIARELKSSRVFGSVAIGAVIKLLGLSLEGVKDIFTRKFDTELAEANIEAAKRGYTLLDKKYELKGQDRGETILISGNEAIALGALAGGVSFYSAYPMTPATSVMTYLSKKQVEAGIVVEQAEDEIAAINMALGASYTGTRAMTGSSGGGVALMVESLGLAGITEIPLVVIDSQRPGPATGLPTRTEQSDLSFLLTASQGEFPRMVLAVRNPEDAFYQTFRALNLADKYQTVVILLTDQYLADYNITIPKFNLNGLKIERHIAGAEVLGEGEVYKRYKLTENGVSPRLIPGKVYGQVVLIDSDEHTETSYITESAEVRNAMMEKRMRKLEELKKEIQEPEYFGVENPEIVLIGWGSTNGVLKEAVELLNKETMKVGALSFGDLYPLPEKKLREFRNKAKFFINVEQNFTGQLAKLIMQETGISMDQSILKYDGRQIEPKEIYEKVKNEVRI